MGSKKRGKGRQGEGKKKNPMETCCHDGRDHPVRTQGINCVSRTTLEVLAAQVQKVPHTAEK